MARSEHNMIACWLFCALILGACAANVSAADPNLLVWWKFDEPAAGTVADASGNGRTGAIQSNPRWLAGVHGGALKFDGANDAVVYAFPQTSFAACTIAFWVRTETFGQDEYCSVFSGYSPNTAGFQIDVDGTSPGNYRINPGAITFGSVTADWVHLALVCEGAGATLYYNGALAATGSLTDALFNQFALGVNRNGNKRFAGMVDDFRFYDGILTVAEIQALAKPDPRLAWSPRPADGSTVDAAEALPLEWSVGDTAIGHDVYFGQDHFSVLRADTSTTGVYRGRQDRADDCYTPPEGLRFGRTYYWRVDEVNGDRTTTKGRLWSFHLHTYSLVDDFDTYEDSEQLRAAWSAEPDGAASLNRHISGASLQLVYNHENPASDTNATLHYQSPRDCAAGRAEALEIRFRGAPENHPASLYVALTDQTGRTSRVHHSDPNVLVQHAWRPPQRWVIPLADFSDCDCTAVTHLTVGVAAATNSIDASTGVLELRSIRLYPPRCLPEYVAASLDEDCLTDVNDLDLLMRHWLAGGYSITAVQPDSARLQVHYKFDETSGTNVADASGYARHAVVQGKTAPLWNGAGHDGGCLDFNGASSVIVPDAVFAGISTQATISVWAGSHAAGWTEFTSQSPSSAQSPDRLTWIEERPAKRDRNWDHYAFVKDAAGASMRLYRNGLLVAENVEAFGPLDGTDAGPSHIGAAADGKSGFYEGKLDDFRIYNYALSHAEILYLSAGADARLHQPLVPVLAPADPQPDGRIDFADFALIAERWLQETLWP